MPHVGLYPGVSLFHLSFGDRIRNTVDMVCRDSLASTSVVQYVLCVNQSLV